VQGDAVVPAVAQEVCVIVMPLAALHSVDPLQVVEAAKVSEQVGAASQVQPAAAVHGASVV